MEWRSSALVRLHQSESFCTLNDASLQRFHNAVLIGPRQHGSSISYQSFLFLALSFLPYLYWLSFQSPLHLSIALWVLIFLPLCLLSSYLLGLLHFLSLSAFMNEEEIHKREIQGRTMNMFLQAIVLVMTVSVLVAPWRCWERVWMCTNDKYKALFILATHTVWCIHTQKWVEG